MKKILSIISFIVLVLPVSCVRETICYTDSGMGMLSMDMTIDAGQQTRAISDDDLINSAVVNIYKADFSGLVRSYLYGEMPSPMYLAADSYRVDVLAGEEVDATPSPASWDSKSYKGSQIFNINPGVVTSVSVVAGINNAVSNVTFDETVAENFRDGFTLTIGLDDEDTSTQLVYNASKSGQNGYFIVAGLDEPSFTWTFTGVLAKDGRTITKKGSVPGLLPGRLYKMNFVYTVKDGDLGFTLVVNTSTDMVDDTIVFEPVSNGLSTSQPYEIWATSAVVHADVDPVEFGDAKVKFAYSTDGINWSEEDAEKDTEATVTAEIKGLKSSTTYTYKLLINGEQVGDAMTFTTEAAPAIPNGGFECVSLVAGQDFYKFYDPNCQNHPECRTKFWASGNGDEDVEGSAKYKTITFVDSDCVEGKNSVRAQSQYAVIKFAAGNIFTGTFAGMVNTEGGKVNFGRPWTSRPKALRVWCKYSTGAINRVDKKPAGVDIVQGSTMDEAEIKFAIGNWDYRKYGGTKDSPVQVNTTDQNTFIDYSTDKSTIAYGNLILCHDGYILNGGAKQAATTNQWKEYLIPLDYDSLTTYPTHIIISCASSRYGDYFTGYDAAALWIDNVELIY